MKNFYFKAILLCFCLFASINAFAYDFEVDDIYYNITDSLNKIVSVTYGDHEYIEVVHKYYGYYQDYSGDITIPKFVEYSSNRYTVTDIGADAFRKCRITSVVIPNSVTSIGDGAFGECLSLSTITIPESVTNISDWAFDDCYFTKNSFVNNSALTDSINWGATLYDAEETSDGLFIKNGTVIKCRESATSVIIPDSVSAIGEYAFHDCYILSSVIISNVTNIEDDTFEWCFNLTSITIGSGVKSISKKAFRDLPRIRNIYVCSRNPTICEGIETFYCRNPYKYEVRDAYDIYNYAILHVPMGTKEEYASAYEWRYFKNIKEDLDINGQIFYTTLSVNHAGDGYVKHYVKAGEPYTLYIGSDEGLRVNTVIFNGKDVTSMLMDGYYTTPDITGPSKIVVSFEQDPDGIESVSADDNLHVYGNDGSLFISGIEEPQVMSVYTLDGKLANSQTLEGDTKIKLNEGVYIVKVGERTFKVSM